MRVPVISLSVRVPLEVDRLRVRLLKKLKCSMPELLKESFEALEAQLKSEDNKA